jgi:para-nitrobenzyl esterase
LYLGQLGEEFAKSGNLGLLDQIFALQWISKNIEQFGGDPENVTVMGQSAGSISVTTLMAVPAAKGLFHRVIAESGAPNLCISKEIAANATQKFMKLANVTDVKGLRKLTAFQLINVQEKLLKESGLSASNIFAPVIDGQVLPEDPFQALENGSASGIPLLLGTNRNEFRLWLIYDPILSYIPPVALLAIFPNSKGVFGNRMAEILLRYRMSQPLAWPSNLTMEILTDSEFWIPQIRMAEVQSNHAPTWMYRFDWPSPFEDGKLGACHALELPFIFHNFNSPETARMAGTFPPMKLADKMQNIWITFIRTGDPNTGDQPFWPCYNTTQRATMILNLNSSLNYDPNRGWIILQRNSSYSGVKG